MEIEARYDILQEEYFKNIQIESRTLGDLVKNHIVPTAIRYQSVLSENVNRLKKVLDEDVYARVSKEQIDMIVEISERVSLALSGVAQMTEARKVANKIETYFIEKLSKDPESFFLKYCLIKTYLRNQKYEEANCYILNTCHIRDKAKEKVYHENKIKV